MLYFFNHNIITDINNIINGIWLWTTLIVYNSFSISLTTYLLNDIGMNKWHLPTLCEMAPYSNTYTINIAI